jgi:2-dehydro-3-deoxyglucarate aldolase/4-hydroxy-2-oxoheptanedioate aldolase
MSADSLRKALDGTGLAAGVMLYEFNTPGISRILEASDVDFAIFDMEHTGWDVGELRAALAAARATSVLPILRVVRAHYHLIAPALDGGARGVMAPMVESEADARELVGASRYPPLGRRGFGLLYRDDLADGPPAAIERINRDMVVIAQIESALGIENIEAIAAVEGIDLFWLGHYDLSCTLGIPGQFEHPDFNAAVDRLIDAARARGIPVGQMVASAADAAALLGRGFSVFAYNDMWVFEAALRDALAEVRSLPR